MIQTVRKWLTAGAIGVALVLAVLMVSGFGAAAQDSNLSFFNPVLAQLQQVKVKVQLPTYVSSKGFSGKMYPVLLTGTADNYEVLLTGNPQCKGEAACFYASIRGEKLLRVSASLDQMLLDSQVFYSKYKLEHRAPYEPALITLSNGTKAEVHPWVRAMRYTYARVTWDGEGVRYQVVMKKGDKNEMVKMANSMVELRSR